VTAIASSTTKYNAVIDLPAEYYLDTIKIVFQEQSPAERHLARARPALAPETSDRAPVLNRGELDDISGSGQTQAAHELCSGIFQNRATCT